MNSGVASGQLVMIQADSLSMRLSRNPKVFLEDKPAADDHRRHGRLRCESTRSCIGEVLDISASGMRIKRRGKPILDVGDTFNVSVQHENDGQTITLPARVVWVERLGFRRLMYGLEFPELDDEHRQKLALLARIVTDQVVFRAAS